MTIFQRFPSAILSLFGLSAIAPDRREVQGVDVSTYQGMIDWETLSKHIHFAYIKCTESKVQVDDQFQRNWAQSKQYKRARGAYHFLRVHATPKSAFTQADHFVEVLLASGDTGELPPMLDVETNDDDVDKTAYEGFVTKWLMRVEEKLGKRPIIYTNLKTWNENMPLAAAGKPSTNLSRDYEICVASWGGTKPTMPYDFAYRKNKTWLFWQYIVANYGVVPGIPVDRRCDRDTFNGSLVEFNQKFSLSVPPLPSPNPTPTPPPHTYPVLPRAIVVTSTLNVRTGPGTQFPKVGSLMNGDTVEVISETSQTNPPVANNTWLRIGHNQYIAYYYDGAMYLSFL